MPDPRKTIIKNHDSACKNMERAKTHILVMGAIFHEYDSPEQACACHEIVEAIDSLLLAVESFKSQY